MKTIDTGGPAFPQLHESSKFAPGMTLRDYLAAKAMQSYILCINNWDEEEISEASYVMADAMLKAREE